MHHNHLALRAARSQQYQGLLVFGRTVTRAHPLGVDPTQLEAPLADGLVDEYHAALGHQRLEIALPALDYTSKNRRAVARLTGIAD
jgi:hypothetical protein